MEDEVWLPIKKDPRYIVSSLGRVARIKSPWKSKGRSVIPRLRLRLSSKSKVLSVHRLVAEAFLLNPQKKLQVNHKDGNPQNNCVWNLEWATPSENNLHAYKNGLNHGHNKFSKNGENKNGRN